MEKANLKEWLSDGNVVFLGGAGVSTESGIPDFRGEKGGFKTRSQYGYDPETILSHDFFNQHTAIFYEYYKSLLLSSDAQPNDAHIALAKLERDGLLNAIITQNIDGLHQKAGSQNVLELHGSMLRNYCVRCSAPAGVERITGSQGIPACLQCGGTLKPDVVLYGEGLDQTVLSAAVDAIISAKTLIVGGTSLQVYPAAGLVNYYRGNRLVLINRDATPYDNRADALVRANIGATLGKLILGK